MAAMTASGAMRWRGAGALASALLAAQLVAATAVTPQRADALDPMGSRQRLHLGAFLQNSL